LALLCSNRPEFAEVMYAAERAGIRVTPIPLDFTPREAEYILDDCRAKAAIVDSRIDEWLIDMVRRKDRLRVKLIIGGGRPGAESYEAALASASALRFDCGRTGIPMLYTSGTTGFPKGVYRQEAMSNLTMADFSEWITFTPDNDQSLCCRRLYRSGVYNLSIKLPLSSGVGVVMVTEDDPRAILALIAQHKITYIYLVPTLLRRILQLREQVRNGHDLSSLKMILHTGAPCPIHVKRGLIEWLGPVLTELYAGTEGGYTFISSNEWLRKPGSVGKATGCAAVLDENGNTLPSGAIGQVYIDAPEHGRFEYFCAPEKTRSAYRGDRFTLGDFGYVDDDGYLYLTGRSADIIVLGHGINVYPAEVEAALLLHSSVVDALVYGVPHPELGEEVRALIQLAPGQTADDALLAGLTGHCRASLAAYKCPSNFEFADEVPRLPTGKLDRELIRSLRR
jgi:long-chain acyl-CoA synthetase